jgi:hypothetical protein
MESPSCTLVTVPVKVSVIGSLVLQAVTSVVSSTRVNLFITFFKSTSADKVYQPSGEYIKE